MTERQQRLQQAGVLLIRGATSVGGAVGVLCFFVALTGHERLVFLFLAAALAMPVTLVSLAVARPDPGKSKPNARPTWRTFPYVVGAMFANTLIFVEPDAYLAVGFVVISGLTLVGICRAGAPSRPLS